MVNADDRWNLVAEPIAEPLHEAAASPVPAWTWQRLNLSRFAGALGHEHSDAPATGIGGLRAGLVDADVAVELGF